MAERLTTHVIDTAHGRPAAGVALTLRRDGEVVARAVTNADGRTDAPLVEGADLVAGVYELTFAVGDYFTGSEGFLDEVPVRFTVEAGAGALHVPLLVSPWSYTTYRGS
jgi:5-hydroxyisourate hydrolase